MLVVPGNMKSTCAVIFWLTTCSTCQTANPCGDGGVNTKLNLSNASTLLLDHSSETLYLGARGSILALHTSNLTCKYPPIKWEVSEKERTECSSKGQEEDDCGNYICLLEFWQNGMIYICGSYAFNPMCAFLDPASFTLVKDGGDKVKMEVGKGKCPFNPRRSHTALTADGVLYTASSSNFLGTEFDITKATAPPNKLVRMDQPIKLLNEPDFVSSALVKGNLGEDDQIYFFFTENAREFKFYSKVSVTRVARVCKGDIGGAKTLQQRWTSFLKAQLVCEEPDRGQRYTVLTHVYPLEHRAGDPSSTHFYALFTAQWGERVSAVCVYSLSDINSVFATGSFRNRKTGNSDPAPNPRPGQCKYNNQTAQVYDSLQTPDVVLQFIKEHSLMTQTVNTAPLLVRSGIKYIRITASNISNNQGELHSVSVVGRNAILLTEIPITNLVEPINNILIHQGHALVSTPSSLSRVLVEGCGPYPSCEACARAQGLSCVWDLMNATCVNMSAQSRVRNTSDDPFKMCGTGEEGVVPLRSRSCMSGVAWWLSCLASTSPMSLVPGSTLRATTPFCTAPTWRSPSLKTMWAATRAAAKPRATVPWKATSASLLPTS
ncbi:hypothetical protein UPYG_G00044310 [Umbra pygmaea]|uniref:Sema domain-containing protein n=1 Tax=Umbra pygmaea TaxID=75934 RepID=A0ABD0XTH8_UMBPY